MHKALWLLQNDLEFRERLRSQPEAALADLPLTDVERHAFLSRDMAELYRMGTHTFFMSRLPRFNALGGLTRAEYQSSLRRSWTIRSAACAQDVDRLLDRPRAPPAP